MKKAIVFVDVQNDFVKGGALPFGYPVEDNVQKIVDFAKECVDAYCNDSTNCVGIYVTRDTHDDNYITSLEGQKLPVKHCIEGTRGWQIVDPLMDVIAGKCTFINKPTFGSYDLAEVIYEDFNKDIDEIVLVGYDLSICVLANAVLLRAKYPDVKMTVRADLCGDVDREAFNAAVKVLKMQQIDVEGCLVNTIKQIYDACPTEAELDAEDEQELIAAKARIASAEAQSR